MEPYMISLDSATVKSSGIILTKDTKDWKVVLQYEVKSLETQHFMHFKVSRDSFTKEQALQKYQKTILRFSI